MSGVYTVGGRTNAVTAAAANEFVFNIWNPSSTRTLHVMRMSLFKTAAGGNEELAPVRSSARGATPGSTVTPGIAQDHSRAVAPPSGFVIETANFTTEPTIDGVAIGERWMAPNVLGSGFVWRFEEPIDVYPGAGLGIAQLTSALAVPICDFAITLRES